MLPSSLLRLLVLVILMQAHLLTAIAGSLVALIWLRMQITRIQGEEALLSQDAQYQRYVRQVRWRMLPGMW